MADVTVRASVKGMSDSPFHRLDVQGLRGFAILIGVPFHAGLAPPGGFVGLDVFFVVSGFVIANMIDREWSSTGRFRFGQFYLRRFKRLTPALALTVGVTMIAAFFLLSPFGPQQLAAETGLGAMLLGANFVIITNTGDYFGPTAESNALLHTWSLSVEEQFYVVFPAILMLGWVLGRHARRLPWTTILVGAVVLVSLSLALAPPPTTGPLAPYAHYLLGYYGPVSRAWEFAAGGLLALLTRNRTVGSARRARHLAVLGAALLLSSPWVITADTAYPSAWTLLPVAGTLLLIASGTGHDTWASRALSTPPMVALGNWSYSIYLWHWPMIVFANHLWPTVSYAAPLAALLSLIPAVASYRWVEQPIRRLPTRTRPRTAALVAGVVLPPIVLAATLNVAADDYWLPRYESGTIPIAHQGDVGDWASYFGSLDETYYPCADTAVRSGALQWSGHARCRQSQPGPRVDAVVFGDSHAEHLFVGLAEALPRRNVLYSVPGPLPGGRLDSEDSTRIVDYVVATPSIRTVIVNIGWSKRGLQADDLRHVLETLAAAGKAVFVTDDIPNYGFDAMDCKYRPAPILPFTRCTLERPLFDEEYATYADQLREIVAQVPGTHVIETARYFCDADYCRMTDGDRLIYRDANHLNDAGSRFLVDRMLADNPRLRTALS